MATYEKIANVKGPKGNGVGNPRLSGDNLLLDILDGTQTAEVGRVIGNVRGPQGVQGVQGVQGIQGVTGATPAISVSAQTLPPGAAATVYRTGTDEAPQVQFGIPTGLHGAKGDKGDRGPLPVLTASATTGDPGTAATVSVTPTTDGGALAFRVPRGDVGATPLLTFEQPINLAPGSQPLVNVTQPAPGSYRLQLGLVQGPSGAASQSIKDDTTSTESSWSSSKTRTEIDSKVYDAATGSSTAWSSSKTSSEINSRSAAAAQAIIQSGSSATSVYSSERTDAIVQAAIASYVPEWADLDGVPSTFPPSAHSHPWADITGKPATFTPSAHTHAAADVTSGVFAAARLPAGTDTVAGAVELATTVEVTTGTDAVRAVTPRGIKQGYNLTPWRPDTVIIGSSNATGGATQWPAKLCAMMGWTERNFAIGGGAFSQNFSTMIDNASASTDFANTDVGQVFIVDASNDTRAGTTIDTAVANVFQKAKTTFPNARIICLPEIWPPDTTNVSTVPGGFQDWWWDKLAEHTDVMRRAARLYGIDYIDDSWTWFLGMTALQKPNEVHLTTEGHTLIAQYVRSWLAGNDVRGRRPWTKVPPTGSYYSTDDGLIAAGRGLRVIAEGNTVTARGLMSAAGPTAPDSDWAVVPWGFRPCFLTSIVLTQHSSGLVVPAKVYQNGMIRSNPATNGGVFYLDATWQRA